MCEKSLWTLFSFPFNLFRTIYQWFCLYFCYILWLLAYGQSATHKTFQATHRAYGASSFICYSRSSVKPADIQIMIRILPSISYNPVPWNYGVCMVSVYINDIDCCMNGHLIQITGYNLSRIFSVFVRANGRFIRVLISVFPRLKRVPRWKIKCNR